MYVAISIILGLVTVVAGCGDTPELSVDVSDGPVNFTQVYNILQGKCVPCHNPNASGGLTWTDLDSAYAHLVGVTAPGGPCKGNMLVDSGNPAASLLYNKLWDSTMCGAKMPLMRDGGVDITDDDMEIIRIWIDQDAGL